tara:strand:+ start:3707 stop:3931 length:225 start_codon:yes stop_codon:yes gene_type:complete
MNKPWFKVKRYGYGCSPNSKEGWFVTILFTLIILSIVLSQDNDFIVILELAVLTLIFVYFAKKKTDEPWKWRWG